MEEPTQPKKNNFKNKIKKIPKGYFVLSTSILAIALVLVSFFEIGIGITGGTIGVNTQEAGEKVMDFIKSQNNKAELIEINENNNFYEVILLIQGNPIPIYLNITKDGEYLIPPQSLIPLAPQEMPQQPQAPATPKDKPQNQDIKTFYDSQKEICYKDGKPVIRMYSSSRCSYCEWNSPVYEKVVEEYVDQGKIIAYLWEDSSIDLLNNITMPESEKDIYSSYGFSGVPAFVFGCKYYRGGTSYSREENGEQLEEEELRNVIEDLINIKNENK